MIGRIDNLLDHGYVIFHEALGSDLTPVNAAKVSHDRASTEVGPKEERLMGFLADANPPHTSPFRHALLQFESFAPLMVARQWFKYIIGSGHKEFDGGLQDPFTAWNESSRRYVTEEPVFYLVQADQWRSSPENKKQGSGEPLPIEIGKQLTMNLQAHYETGQSYYEDAMRVGVCAEQARLFLPAYGLYVRWYWTASLQGVAHFLDQRLEHTAQKEIQVFAEAVQELSMMRFPVALGKLLNRG